MHIVKYCCGEPQNEASQAFGNWLAETKTDRSYHAMMQHRVAGLAAKECTDTYFLAMEAGKAVARLWNGWGNHSNAAGNFGNFLIREEFRGGGLSKKMLDAWYEDIMQRQNRPLGLFCSVGQPWLIDYYGRYGFRVAVRDDGHMRLYKPLGDSPEDFWELCENYYSDAQSFTVRPAAVEWRHEIDCMLQFYMDMVGEPFGFAEAPSLEAVLMKPELGKAELLFTEKNRPVGWAFTPSGGEKTWQIHPSFRKQFEEMDR